MAGDHLRRDSSIKLGLDIKKFGASGENCVTTPNVLYKVSFFLRIIIKGIPWIPLIIPLIMFSLEFTFKSETSINNSVLFALPTAECLAYSGKVCGS